MTPSDAKKIILALADAIDPETGELLEDSSPFNQPQVIRALYLAYRALEQMKPGDRAVEHESQVERAGKPWSKQEDEQLLAAFDRGSSPAALARAHQRSRGAITSRLVRLGRLDRSHLPNGDA